ANRPPGPGLIPVQVVGLLTALMIAWWLGLRERTRLAAVVPSSPVIDIDAVGAEKDAAPARPHSPLRFWINIALTAVTLAVLLLELWPAAAVFMVATVLALVVNFPGADQ